MSLSEKMEEKEEKEKEEEGFIPFWWFPIEWLSPS